MKRKRQYKNAACIPLQYHWTMTARERGAVLARRALRGAYGADCTANGWETSVADLLADLRHFCDAARLDFNEVDSQGYKHYRHELFHEE